MILHASAYVDVYVLCVCIVVMAVQQIHQLKKNFSKINSWYWLVQAIDRNSLYCIVLWFDEKV